MRLRALTATARAERQSSCPAASRAQRAPFHVFQRPSPRGFDVHENAWVGLGYLVFAYVPLLFMPPRTATPLLATLFATALFLPLYFGSYRRTPGTSAVPWMLAIAAIGYALIPLNGGGNTFVIYALAIAAANLAPRAAIGWGVLLAAAMIVEFLLVIPLWRVAAGVSVVMVVVGALVMSGIMYSRMRAREVSQLQLTQDEVRRLAALAERERIGRDLHDLLGHTLSVVALKSELAGKLIERDPVAARAQIRDVETVARDALAQVREAVAGIRAAGLQAELASARVALLAADVRLDQRLAPAAIDAPVEQALALALREAVTNIVRHAQAQRVEVELTDEHARLQLTIADDGRGGVERAGNGLTGMRERIEAVGGTLDIDSARGAGTRVVLRVPHAARTGAAA
jgi:two-component system, NarL family, sensor histidine kinase DesK